VNKHQWLKNYTNGLGMNKNFLKLPSEHFWILTKREKSQLLTELKRRVEVLS